MYQNEAWDQLWAFEIGENFTVFIIINNGNSWWIYLIRRDNWLKWFWNQWRKGRKKEHYYIKSTNLCITRWKKKMKIHKTSMKTETIIYSTSDKNNWYCQVKFQIKII